MDSPSSLCSSRLNVLVLSSCTGLFVYCKCKVPHASIRLQVGEEKLVLDIGQAALRRADSKPYVHDVLLAMALAEVSTMHD